MVNYKERGALSSVGRAPDCDSGCRGFKPRRAPQFISLTQSRTMTNLNIVDLDGLLLVQAERTLSLMDRAWSVFATATCAGSAGSFVVGNHGAVLLAILAGAINFFFARRTRKFELRVTRNELSARGRAGDNPNNLRSVPTVDIQWLEYQQDATGPENADHPAGLYAVLKHRSVCLLPDIGEQQTSLVIDRINEKYPGLRTQWAGQSAFGKNFTTLKLVDG